MAITKRSKAPANSNVGSSKNPAVLPPVAAPSVETIAIRAYQIWRENGCAHGDDQANWFRAEQELRAGTTRAR
jgi:hypothetical protein